MTEFTPFLSLFGGALIGVMQTDTATFIAAMITGIAVTRVARQAVSRSPGVQKAAS
jgi:hypothetical protein